jgi:hypothetical protein
VLSTFRSFSVTSLWGLIWFDFGTLKIWYNLFNEIVNKHAPIVTKRVKRDKQPEWYNTEVQYARQINMLL